MQQRSRCGHIQDSLPSLDTQPEFAIVPHGQQGKATCHSARTSGLFRRRPAFQCRGVNGLCFVREIPTILVHDRVYLGTNNSGGAAGL